ncbi:hypothetical protein P879_10076 [Paragonimus westermani]|uniref:BPTI/Kunitz inhibitor domain-containing protein n=1 Tax=Paragonimus westermani TaxID=34504 RepID=A0A8T0DHS9_9TREM|nr:hypothetical protein P879_10076 [Paragonimus westermani]
MNCRVITVVLLLALVGLALFGQCGAIAPFCLLPIDRGHCRALMKNYAYDKAKGECVLFYHGGCGGNANIFQTKQECEQMCK